jgi:hypothetical protein
MRWLLVPMAVFIISMTTIDRTWTSSWGNRARCQPQATPIEDTYVDDWDSASTPRYTVHDKEGSLFVSRSDTIPIRRIALIHFDLKESTIENVSSVTLRLRTGECPPVPRVGPAPHLIFIVTEAWDASSLDGRFIPKTERRPLSSQWPQAFPSGSWVDWDISLAYQRWINGEPNHGVAILVDDPKFVHSFCEFRSSETESPPQLIVNRRFGPLLLPLVSALDTYRASSWEHSRAIRGR